ncbi:MAG: energy-coupling factor transporter transmembrane protein EcfT [Sphaerochaetaceae bacterium]|nr:energy-coupling factor transporter transmembrane protein EcfT [Spirochaetales bacterium]MDY5498969.1 energy-coupling factor transporter transmembrane protein EcfT [Sphaerochaetaceae bacterium]
MAMIFHYREQDTLLGRANPLTKLFLLLSICIISSGATLAAAIAILVLLGGVAALIRLPLASYGRDLRFFAVMGLLILLVNGLSTGDWALATLLTLRFLDIILAAIIFSDTTDFWDLSCSIAPVLDLIPFVHGWRVASAIQLTIMLVPMVFEVTEQVRDAQQARGAFLGNPVRALATYASQVMETLLDKLDDASDSLDARLFDPDARRASLPMRAGDLPLLVLGAGLLVVRYLC